MSLEPFRNRVFNCDIFELLEELPPNSVHCIFGDPDYNVGVRYNDKSYTRDFDEYIEWYVELARKSLRVLREDGNLFFINYPKQNAYLRVKYLDSACYAVHDYVWVYNTNVGHSPRKFTTAHRSVLHATKSRDNAFYKDHVAEPYKNPTDRRIRHNLANGSKGRMPYSWFYFDLVKNVSYEKATHSCQIPMKLSELLIKASTKEGDDVLILFGGSGAEVAVCLQLKRNFIAAEIDPKYYQIILDRIAHQGNLTEDHRLIHHMKSDPPSSTSLQRLTLFEHTEVYAAERW